jgi:hypothetical protein
MTTPETTSSETAASGTAESEAAKYEAAAQEEAKQAAAEQAAARDKMQGYFPYCPPREHFPVVTGFVTPGSDFPPPHPLDASINMDVYDPTETISRGKFERIRVVEIDDEWLIEVNWCICGAFAATICGCWELRFYLDDVDGVGQSSGPLPNSTRRVPVESVKPVPGKDDDFTRRCYTKQVSIPANTVKKGAYSLLAVITLREGTCRRPGKPLGDYLGFAQIPVLVFVEGE